MQIPDAALDQLFNQARTANGFTARPVEPELLQQVYELARMGPTSMNCQPARFTFLCTEAARERLLPALSPGNVDKVRSAPVTAIVATDTLFYEFMPQVWHRAGARESFEANAAMASATATRNGTLTGAYFLMAARALGLDCGPMSGADMAKVNTEFFPDGRWQANFLMTLGYADHSLEFTRNPRLAFDQACRIL